MGVKFNLNTQIILAQLNNLYKTGGSFGLYDKVYNFLLSQGHDLSASPDKKTVFWDKSKTRIEKDHPLWFNGQMSKEQLMAECTKYYKSYLTADYLLNIEKTTGQRLNILDEHENKITLLTHKEYEENKGK